MNRSHPAPESHVFYEAQAQSRGSAPVTILCSILFLSGTGALIFETLWLRLSGLAFGNSVWAAALGFCMGWCPLVGLVALCFGEVYSLRRFVVQGQGLVAALGS